MTKIIELAHKLGEAIAESEEIKSLQTAKDAFDKDAELQEYMSEYEADRRLIGEELSKSTDEADEKVIADLRARLGELNDLIAAKDAYRDFAKAQQAMDALMADVNDEIRFCITGERPEKCTHDCSTCSGCH